jgi:hypothetical protein
MTRFERRVRQLEARAGAGRATIPPEFEIWIELKDGGMRGEDGEIISRKAFEQRRTNARAILVLPDNGRDPDLIKPVPDPRVRANSADQLRRNGEDQVT